MYDKIKENFPQKTKLAVSITGGGLQFFNSLVSQGGTSRFFALGEIPYASELQPMVKKSVSREYTLVETSKIYDRVSRSFSDNVVCVAASFALTKIENEREDRINHGHIGVLSKSGFVDYNFVLLKQKLPNRQEQEEAAALLVAAVIYKETIDKNFDIRIPGVVKVVEKYEQA
jgi:hypothetical protein